MTPQIIKPEDGYRGDTYVFPLFSLYDVSEIITSGLLDVGSEYCISKFNGDDSFTNVGAASNETGEIFEATGELPASWFDESELIKITAITKTIVDIRMMVKDSEGAVSIYKYLGNGITLTDNTVIEIEPFIVDIVGGEYSYDIELTYDDDTIETFAKGCWNIQEDVTDNETIEGSMYYSGFAELRTEGISVVDFTTAIFDVNGTTNKILNFDRIKNEGSLFTAIANRITIGAACKVKITFSADYLCTLAGVYNVQIFKNGVIKTTSKAYTTGQTFEYCAHSICYTDDCVEGDYYDVRIKRDQAGLATFTTARAVLLIEKK